MRFKGDVEFEISVKIDELLLGRALGLLGQNIKYFSTRKTIRDNLRFKYIILTCLITSYSFSLETNRLVRFWILLICFSF